MNTNTEVIPPTNFKARKRDAKLSNPDLNVRLGEGGTGESCRNYAFLHLTLKSDQYDQRVQR